MRNIWVGSLVNYKEGGTKKNVKKIFTFLNFHVLRLCAFLLVTSWFAPFKPTRQHFAPQPNLHPLNRFQWQFSPATLSPMSIKWCYTLSAWQFTTLTLLPTVDRLFVQPRVYVFSSYKDCLSQCDTSITFVTVWHFYHCNFASPWLGHFDSVLNVQLRPAHHVTIFPPPSIQSNTLGWTQKT
jgi:hypothetical protein